MNQIDIGILGRGFIGKLHHEELEQIRGVGVSCIADKNPGRFEGLMPGVRTYSDYIELLKKERPDAIIVALPDRFHVGALEVIAENSPKSVVLLEKPLGCNMQEALQIQRIVEKEHVRTMIGLTGHYHPEFRAAYANLASIGKVLGLDERIHLGMDNLAAQTYLPNKGRGIVLENGFHTFDRFAQFTRSVIDLNSIELDHMDDRNFKRECDDDASGKLKTANDIEARFSFAWYNRGCEDYVFTINGEDGQIQVSGFRNCELRLKEQVPKTLFEHDTSLSLTARHRPGIRAELEDFKKFVLGNSDSYLLEPALEAQAVVEKIYKIARK